MLTGRIASSREYLDLRGNIEEEVLLEMPEYKKAVDEYNTQESKYLRQKEIVAGLKADRRIIENNQIRIANYAEKIKFIESYLEPETAKLTRLEKQAKVSFDAKRKLEFLLKDSAVYDKVDFLVKIKLIELRVCKPR